MVLRVSPIGYLSQSSQGLKKVRAKKWKSNIQKKKKKKKKKKRKKSLFMFRQLILTYYRQICALYVFNREKLDLSTKNLFFKYFLKARPKSWWNNNL